MSPARYCNWRNALFGALLYLEKRIARRVAVIGETHRPARHCNWRNGLPGASLSLEKRIVRRVAVIGAGHCPARHDY